MYRTGYNVQCVRGTTVYRTGYSVKCVQGTTVYRTGYMCTGYNMCRTGYSVSVYSVQGLYRGTVYGVQCTIVCCGVNVAYVACLEADTSSVRLAVPARASGWRSDWRSPLERPAGGPAGGPARASGWRSGWRSRSSVRLAVPLERPAGGWLAAGWRSRLCSSGWRSRPCARAAGGWRLGAGGWLGVPLERLAVPTLWRGIVFGGVGLAIGGFWKVFSYPPYKRDFPKPPFCPSRSNKLT